MSCTIIQHQFLFLWVCYYSSISLTDSNLLELALTLFQFFSRCTSYVWISNRRIFSIWRRLSIVWRTFIKNRFPFHDWTFNLQFDIVSFLDIVMRDNLDVISLRFTEYISLFIKCIISFANWSNTVGIDHKKGGRGVDYILLYCTIILPSGCVYTHSTQ
jgi:hypothetical protein